MKLMKIQNLALLKNVRLKKSTFVSILIYGLVSSFLHLLWEIGHLPLYSLWLEKSLAIKSAYILHCTVGDVMIAVLTLLAALICTRNREWPTKNFFQTSALALAFGLGYLVFSEWLNVEIRQSWAYSDNMPTIPPLGTGLTPLLQWIIVPTIALIAAKKSHNYVAKYKIDEAVENETPSNNK